MTSRRPMIRTYSGNGRTSSFSEDEGSSSNGRSESRNTYLSNVRPENRSTLCSVMAQLTEDIQPSFDTTLKSKAVSENCNVKFTCVVSGYPAPELKWYKDDMEMDRYCGLPKYEIRRNGKTHTLHIYNCTLDDAAIYQVSASNSKGIVSCSGVLEVGTMNEYQIHQRFFAKLKQKAEKKKKDLDVHTKKEDKENIQEEKKPTTPERPPRKRHVPSPEQKPAVKEPEAVEQLGAAAEPNGVSSEDKGTTPVITKDSELDREVTLTETSLAKKKIKISNGVDAGVNSTSSSSTNGRNHTMGNGGENCYDGGISLAQFLAEALQSQATEEKQNSSQEENSKEMALPIPNASKEKDHEPERMKKEREEQEKTQQEEYDRQKGREELAMEKEREREKQLAILQNTSNTKHGSEVKHHNKAHKDHEHHNIQASISSMLHTVKDFLFGKSKKDAHDHIDNKEREDDHLPASIQPPQPEMPPSFQLQQEYNQVCKSLTEDVVPMEVDKESSETLDAEKESESLEPHENEDSVLHADLPLTHTLPPESSEESVGQSVKEGEDAVQSMEVSVGSESNGPGEDVPSSGLQVPTEVVSQAVKEFSVQQPDCSIVSPQPDKHVARYESSPRGDIFISPQIKVASEDKSSPTLTLSSLEECWTPPHSVISVSESHSLREVTTETLQVEKICVNEMGIDGEPDMEEVHSGKKFSKEEKGEVKAMDQQHSDIQKYEITELATFSVEEKTEPGDSTTPGQAPVPVSTVKAHDTEREHAKEETKHDSLTQEMNVVFPPAAAPHTFEKGDLKTQQECSFSEVEKSVDVDNRGAVDSHNTDFRGNDDNTELTEVCISALEVDLEVHSSNDQKTKDALVSEGECAEAVNDKVQLEVQDEKKDPLKVEERDESENLSVTQNKEGADVLEQHANVAQQDNRERQQGQPSENIPQIQISTTEDIQDIKPLVPDVNPIEDFIIPKIKMQSELKECTLLPTILALDKHASYSGDLQNNDATHVSEVIIQDQKVAHSSSLLPTQKGMPDDYNFSPAVKVKEVAQLDEFAREQPQLKSSEQLPQMNFASIPLISVSCTDNKEGDVYVNTHVSDMPPTIETPTVPPISVTSHESDSALRLSAESDSVETETTPATQRGTKYAADNNMTIHTEKTWSGKQRLEQMVDKSIKENIASVLYENLTSKVGDNEPSFNTTMEDNIVPETIQKRNLKEAKIENAVSVEELQRNKSSVERLFSKPPTHPSLSPASLRKFMSKSAPESDNEALTTVPVITLGGRQSDKANDDLSGGSTPTSSLSCESSPRLKRRDSLSLIRSATPEELASGARRKIFIPKPKEDGEGAVVGSLDTQGKKEVPYMSPGQARRAALLQASTGQNTPPMERRSPLLSRRKVTLEVPKVTEEISTGEPVSTKQEEKPAEKKPDPLKAPQVIRKIRGEPFPDASGHLKLWCQFFNVLSDSTIKWYRDEEEILQVKRSGGDESQVALAIVLASSQDCGVYGCSISNEYGTDTTDFLLSVDILSEILLKDDLEVGEEIEMTPLLFTKGLADCGGWGNKYFGRIMTETVHVGGGSAHKASRVRVIYGLDPIFESGSTCIIKVQNPVAYGTKQESNLAERNGAITKQECKVQNMIREYCKIFAAEARVVESFGYSLEVIPQYLMYRPANSVPYATVEAELKGVFLKYCMMDPKGRLITRTVSEVEQKCSTFQHWIHQWTHGNLLVTQMEGVETKITNVRVVTKSKGYQGLTECGSPEIFEQFLTHHQCNYYCGLLGLKPLKTMESLQPSTKMKGSRSPLLNRKLGSSSPQLQKKGQSPQMLRKANSSPKVTRKVQETEDNKSGAKSKTVETADVLEMSYQSQQGHDE